MPPPPGSLSRYGFPSLCSRKSGLPSSEHRSDALSPTPICSPVDLWAHIFPLLWLWVAWEPNRGTVPSRCLNNLYKGWQRNLVNSAYPSCNRIAIFFVLKATKTAVEADVVPKGTDLHLQALGRSRGRLLGWTARPRAPHRRRGMESGDPARPGLPWPLRLLSCGATAGRADAADWSL